MNVFEFHEFPDIRFARLGDPYSAYAVSIDGEDVVVLTCWVGSDFVDGNWRRVSPRSRQMTLKPYDNSAFEPLEQRTASKSLLRKIARGEKSIERLTGSASTKGSNGDPGYAIYQIVHRCLPEHLKRHGDTQEWRRCLKCGQMFLSLGSRNRICKRHIKKTRCGLDPVRVHVGEDR